MRRAFAIVRYGGSEFMVKGELKKGRLALSYKEATQGGEKTPRNAKLVFSAEVKDGFLLELEFPFKGRKRIALVLKSQLEPLLPVPVDTLISDFKETGNGKVLTLSVPKSTVEDVKRIFNPVLFTSNALSVLYAVCFFRVSDANDWAFVYTEGSVVTLVEFRGGRFFSLKQWYFSKENFVERLAQEIRKKNLQCLCLLGEKFPEEMEREIEAISNIKVMIPEAKDYFEANNYPPWIWAAAGAVLIAISGSKNEINLLRNERSLARYRAPLTFGLLFVFGCSFLCFVLLITELNLRERAYRELAKEEMKVYRSIFPGSPPTTEIEKILREKLRESQSEGKTKIESHSPLTLLGEISKKLDSSIDVKLSDFSMDERGFSISGFTTSFSSAEKIRETLQKIESVSGVTIEMIEPSGNQVKFKIRGVF